VGNGRFQSSLPVDVSAVNSDAEWVMTEEKVWKAWKSLNCHGDGVRIRLREGAGS
jgi:hypothetical protein